MEEQKEKSQEQKAAKDPKAAPQAEPAKDAPSAEETKKEQNAPAATATKEAKPELPGKMKGIMESIESMTVLELSDFVKALEDRFGVQAAAPMVAGVAMPGAGGTGAPAEEEKTSFTVVLAAAGEKKIQVIKELRVITSLGLKDAKDLVDSAPKPIKEGATKEEAEKIKKQIEAVGGKVELK